MKKLSRIIAEAFWAIGSLKNFPIYFWARAKLFTDQEIQLNLRNGISYIIRTNTGETALIEEIWHRKVYDPLMPYIKDGSTVVDIGGNIGIFSVKAALAAKNVRVIAYEPVPANVALLKKNITLNHLENCVVIKQLGVAGKSGEADLFYEEHDTGGGSIRHARENSKSIKVSCTTIADIFSDQGIEQCDFLKIDCEGAEEDILLNAPPELFKRIHSMTIEWHENLSQFGLENFKFFLEQAGYDVKFDSQTITLYAKSRNGNL